jgi:D-isomer specific 2-hydroxyacid dehydrogenase-like protein
MDPSRPPLVVAFELSQKRKAIVADALAGASAVVYLTELDETARTEALRNTGVLLTFNTSEELQPGEAKLLNSARLIQFMIGGVDFIPLGEPAINRRGRTDQHVDWIGTPERLNELLEAADVLLISVPLTRATYGLIGAAELRRMKDDAILINLARGEIVQEPGVRGSDNTAPQAKDAPEALRSLNSQ